MQAVKDRRKEIKERVKQGEKGGKTRQRKRRAIAARVKLYLTSALCGRQIGAKRKTGEWREEETRQLASGEQSEQRRS